MPDNDNEQDRRDRERPRRVKWASKNLVEHFEHVPLKDEDAGDVDEHSKALDEYGRDVRLLYFLVIFIGFFNIIFHYFTSLLRSQSSIEH